MRYAGPWRQGLTTLNWNSHRINDYIAEVMSSVKELNNILETVKGNVEKTKKRLGKWETNLMLNRKEGKTYEVGHMVQVEPGSYLILQSCSPFSAQLKPCPC